MKLIVQISDVITQNHMYILKNNNNYYEKTIPETDKKSPTN